MSEPNPSPSPEVTPEVAPAGPPPSQPTVLTQKTPETAPGEGKPQEPAAVVPEKYDFKLPQGVSLHPELQAKFETLAKEVKLTNEQAQKFVEIDLARRNAERDASVAERKAWIEQGKSDKEFGGAKYEETLGLAQAGLSKFADAHAVGLVEATGLGDHPAFLRMFSKIAKAFGEDKTAGVTSTTGAPERSFADQFYEKATKAGGTAETKAS